MSSNPEIAADVPEDTEETRPLNSFPKSVFDALRALSLTGKLDGVAVLGSGARRVVQYPSDFDGYAVFKAPYASKQKCAEWAAAQFQQCVSKLLALPSTFLGDVKAGLLQDCRILPYQAFLKGGTQLVGYERKKAEARVVEMHKKGLLTDAEFKHTMDMLQEAGDRPDAEAWLHLCESLRFEVVRWTLDDIRKGEQTVRGNRVLTLAEAIAQDALFKVDCVIWNASVSRYQDLSLIYEVQDSKGNVVNDASATMLPLQQSIGMDVVKYMHKGKWMKVSKRILSLATLHKKDKDEYALIRITNSDAGRLYGVAADCGCLEWILENAQHYDSAKVEIEVDAFRSRIASAAVILEEYDELEESTFKDVAAILRAKSPKEMLAPLQSLTEALSEPVNECARVMLEAAKLLPVPKWALP
jgi:hypothetical protein